jgi:hypothetical protein
MVITILVSMVFDTNLACLDVIMGSSVINNKKDKGPKIDLCPQLSWIS